MPNYSPFARLDVLPNANNRQIKVKFHQLSKLQHPDNCPNKSDAAAVARWGQLYKEITESYRALIDPVTREYFLPKNVPNGDWAGAWKNAAAAAEREVEKRRREDEQREEQSRKRQRTEIEKDKEEAKAAADREERELHDARRVAEEKRKLRAAELIRKRQDLADRRSQSGRRTTETEERPDAEGEMRPSLAKTKGRGGRRSGPPKVSVVAEEVDLGDLHVVVDGIDGVMESVLKCAKLTLSGFEGIETLPESEVQKNKKHALNEYHDVAFVLSEMKQKIRAIPFTVHLTYDQLEIEDLAKEETNIEQFLALINQFEETAKKDVDEVCGKIGEEQVNLDPTYRHVIDGLSKFVNRINVTNDDAPGPSPRAPPAPETYSEGVETLTDYIPIIDPITRRLIRNPVVNVECKHVYDYDSIMNMLITSSAKGRFLCPYAGCSSKTPITPDSLQKDEKIAKAIAEEIRKRSM